MAKSTAYYNSCVNAPLLLLPRLDPFFFFHEKIFIVTWIRTRDRSNACLRPATDQLVTRIALIISKIEQFKRAFV